MSQKQTCHRGRVEEKFSTLSSLKTNTSHYGLLVMVGDYIFLSNLELATFEFWTHFRRCTFSNEGSKSHETTSFVGNPRAADIKCVQVTTHKPTVIVNSLVVACAPSCIQPHLWLIIHTINLLPCVFVAC